MPPFHASRFVSRVSLRKLYEIPQPKIEVALSFLRNFFNLFSGSTTIDLINLEVTAECEEPHDEPRRGYFGCIGAWSSGEKLCATNLRVDIGYG